MISDIISSGAIGTPISITANLGYELTGGSADESGVGRSALLDVGVYAINFALIFWGRIMDPLLPGQY